MFGRGTRRPTVVVIHERPPWSRTRWSAKQRAAVLKRSKGRCGICGGKIRRSELWHIHHVVPISRGGSNGPENLIATHAACNLKVGTHIVKPNKKVTRRRRWWTAWLVRI